MQIFSSSKRFITLISVLLIIYCVSHLVGLTRLPVFADEAIYIRWAQLIIDDSPRYLFFSLNDGKTPLFIWQLLPSLLLFENPLLAARLVSVLGGLFQIIAMVWLIRELKGNKMAQFSGAVLTTFLPFWFFHHRMALMDGWLTVWLTVALALLLKSINQKNIWLAMVSGICVAASLLTKIPAVLALPSLLFISFSVVNVRKQDWSFLRYVLISGITGGILFGLLYFAPSFSQLFTRGGDFLFSMDEVLQGIWFTTIKNTPSYVNYFWAYATPPVLILFLASLAYGKHRTRSMSIWMSFLVFYLPIALMGVVVFPRYLFPCMLFVTLGAALCIGDLYSSKQKIIKWLSVGTLVTAVLFSLPFIYYLSVNPNKTPFVSADVMQYLTEWSAGHGNREVYEKLMQEAESHRVAVATEGYFGTLPDGLIMYIHNKDVNNIAIDGVGQPITGIPKELLQKKNDYDVFWLVVNSHRLETKFPEKALIASYCRPYNAPCLQLWDLTEIVKSSE